MKVPSEVIKKAADVFVQSMADPPPGCAGRDLHVVAMEAAIEQIVEDIRLAVRLSMAEPHASKPGESVSLIEMEQMIFTTMAGSMLRRGIPFLSVPIESPIFDNVVTLMREASGGDLPVEFTAWLSRVRAARESLHGVKH